eukprot:1432533-Rhodomonas_salina.1
MTCRRLEREQLEFLEKEGTFSGDCISEEGCRRLGISEDKIRELVDGVRFEVDPTLPHYSREPYSTVYSLIDILLMAVKDYNRLLGLGKVFPIRRQAYIECRSTAV